MNVLESIRLICDWYAECDIELIGNISAKECDTIEECPEYETFDWFNDSGLYTHKHRPDMKAYAITCTKNGTLVMCTLFWHA